MTANAAVTRAIASRVSPTILFDKENLLRAPARQRGPIVFFPNRWPFSISIIRLAGAEGREAAPCRGSGRPGLLEEFKVGLDEVRTVRPQRGLSIAADRLLVLDEECEDRLAVDDDEARALAVDVPQRDVLRDPGPEHLVRFVDVRREPRFHPATHRREEGLVDPGAVRPLQALRRREGEDLRLRGGDELLQGAVDLCPALDHLKANARRFPGPSGELGPRLQERLPDPVEFLELRALLLRDHVEHLVDRPGRIPTGTVQRDLDEPAGFKPLEGSVRLHAIYAARSGDIPGRRRPGAGEVHEHDGLVPAQADPLKRFGGL